MIPIGIDGEYAGDYYSDAEADSLYARREELMAEGLSFNDAYQQSVEELMEPTQ